MDLRQFTTWCAQHDTTPGGWTSSATRQLAARGRARATVARRLSTVAGFDRCAEQEGLIARWPAVHVRRPRLDYDSHTVGLDRNELGALLVAAALAGPREHALVSLLGLNGLRFSEALGADIDDCTSSAEAPALAGSEAVVVVMGRDPFRHSRGPSDHARLHNPSLQRCSVLPVAMLE